MTHKEKFIRALRREPVTGHVPHFEMVFCLTAESLGKLHPYQRNYAQWNQMTLSEKKWHIEDVADLFLDTARKYQHSAIFVHTPFPDFDATKELLRTIREKGNDEFYLMMDGDATFPMPSGSDMLDFTASLYEEEDKMCSEAQRRVEFFSETARKIADEKLLDGYILCSDYCFNVNPFFGPDLFDTFIGPYLKEILRRYHEMGFYTIKHTDGNIMPILSRIVDCGPDALHSLDPQGGVSLAEVKRLYGDRVALIGNVNCGLLQTGTEEECDADVRRALREGMEGWGYIFSTSNCVYIGLPLERYERMHRIWREEGIYREEKP